VKEETPAQRPAISDIPARVYIYELRRGDDIVATGHLDDDRRLEVGARITVGARAGTVRELIPIFGENRQRLIVQLVPEPDQT
jgi:hypothetical protein